jgi:hypothetical protein
MISSQVIGKCHQAKTDSIVDKVKLDCCLRGKSIKFEESPIAVADFLIVKDKEEEIDDDGDESSGDDDDFDEKTCDDHTCQHSCKIQNDQPICVCDEGFSLADDGLTCNPDKIINCDPGYSRNFLNECEDINECENGDHNCDRFEKCENVEGGFDCIRIDCESGLKFNYETEVCEGKI